MASLVLPIFARPVSHVVTGLDEESAASGSGTWFDAGLRSGLPGLRAAQATRPIPAATDGRTAVLLISTDRYDDSPHPTPTNAFPILFQAVGQPVAQQHVWEAAYAAAYFAQREVSLAVLSTDEASLAIPALTRNAVEAVFVPDELPDRLVASAGYAFDRYAMRGLFVWGRLEALRAVEGGLLQRLGWSDLQQNLPALVPEETNLQPWRSAYALDECPAHRLDRVHRARQRLEDHGRFLDCRPLPDRELPYFQRGRP